MATSCLVLQCLDSRDTYEFGSASCSFSCFFSKNYGNVESFLRSVNS